MVVWVYALYLYYCSVLFCVTYFLLLYFNYEERGADRQWTRRREFVNPKIDYRKIIWLLLIYFHTTGRGNNREPNLLSSLLIKGYCFKTRTYYYGCMVPVTPKDLLESIASVMYCMWVAVITQPSPGVTTRKTKSTISLTEAKSEVALHIMSKQGMTYHV